MAATVAMSPAISTGACNNEYTFLEYSPEQKQQQRQHQQDSEQINVKHDASWSYCGPLLNSGLGMPTTFDEFARATFTGPVLPKLLPFLDFVNAFLASNGLHHYFLTVRATTPTHEFDHPRWHTDDLFFANLTGGYLPGSRLGGNGQENRPADPRIAGTDWKICTTLQGPATLFIPHRHQSLARETQRRAQEAASTDHQCLSIRCVGCASAADQVREELDAKLASCGVEAAMSGECTFFRVGRDDGAIHSEPVMSNEQCGRVFVNVVPGTEQELRLLIGKWGMEFPREWWVGSNHILRVHNS
uniref:Uncharacterized protein n=1 Tax=Bionectria ochroleuca TaxID=29856 RepID=A0A8H7NEN3_BIOOC